MKKSIISLAIASLAVLAGCSDFGNLNQDPTKSTDMDPNILLPNLQAMPTNDYQEWHRHFMYPGGFVQQWCGDWGTTEYGCLAIKNDSYMGELWLQRYTRMAKGLADIVDRTADDPAFQNINAAGRILRVYTYTQLTDLYGDIPYFDAGEGYYKGILKPAYDKQEDIYDDFFKQLDMADAQLRTGTDILTYDQYYGGDTEKWRKYANSLHLRLALRLVKVNPEKAKAEAQKAIANGVMTSVEDLCRIKYENVANPSAGPGRGNAVSNRLSADPHNFRYSRRFIQYLEETGDPRLRILAASYFNDDLKQDITDLVYAEKGSYAAMARATDRFDWENYDNDASNPDPSLQIDVNGDGVTEEVTPHMQYLQPSAYFYAYDAPYVNMGYAEVELLQAEAALRWGLGTGTAAEHFAKALAAGVEQMKVYNKDIQPSAASIAAFVAANPLSANQAEALEQINMQIWVGHIFNPFEAFANWRRTGIPEIVFLNRDPARNQSGGKTPRRLLYPVEEQIKNPENYQAAIDRVPGYDWTVGVWWDKQ